MPMIYIHIPFCRSKCFYCGFYSVASEKWKSAYLEALEREIELRDAYLKTKEVDSLYLGGGTPSFLSRTEIEEIIDRIEKRYSFIPMAEKTIEMNPEDMNEQKLRAIKETGFNRLSIGIQSFNNHVLKEINRVHSGEQAFEAVQLAHHMGFENISIDLILGLPGYSSDDMRKDIQMALKLPVNHISMYMLSIDPGSVFAKRFEHPEKNEDEMARLYLEFSRILKENGFDHYEISNFARNDKYSRHNSGYWQQKEYIGFGPGAHSYNKYSRQWNISNVKIYSESLVNGKLVFDREELSLNDQYNEYIMTSLRTRWGIDIREWKTYAGEEWKNIESRMNRYMENSYAKMENNCFMLTEKGWLISDTIFSDFFRISD